MASIISDSSSSASLALSNQTDTSTLLGASSDVNVKDRTNSDIDSNQSVEGSIHSVNKDHTSTHNNRENQNEHNSTSPNDNKNTSDRQSLSEQEIALLQRTSLCKPSQVGYRKQKSVSVKSQSVYNVEQFDDCRRSLRLQDCRSKQQLKSKLKESISMQTEVNCMIFRELKSKPKQDRLKLIRADLADSLKYIHSLHDELKQVDKKHDNDVKVSIDRLSHDIQHIAATVNQQLKDLSSDHQLSEQNEELISMKSPSSATSRTPSNSSARSDNSAILRLKMSEAAAKVAEKESQLITERQVQQVEQELAELERKKRNRLEELRLQGEIEAEKRKAVIFQKAMEMEEQQESGLLLSSHNGPLPSLFHELTGIEVEPTPLPDMTTSLRERDPRMQDEKGLRRTSSIQRKMSTNGVKSPISVADNLVNNTTTAGELVDEESEADFELQPPEETPQSLTRQLTSKESTLPFARKSLEASPTNPTVHSSPQPSIGSVSNRELAEAITSAVNISRLPPPEPFVFDGDPLRYPDWIFAFEGLIGSKHCSVMDKLHYLKRYVDGKAKAVVDGYFLLQSADAYEKAKSDLQKRFGSPFTVSEAFRTKIEHWTPIKSKDGEGLRNFSDFLKQCQTAMHSIPELKILDDNRENRKMLQKVPEWVTRKWARHVTTYEQKYSVFPKFTVFCQFLAKEADVACSPMMASLNTSSQKLEPKKSDKRTHVSLKTEQSRHSDEKQNTQNANLSHEVCIFCNMNNHTTAQCGKVKALRFADLNTFMKSNHLCFACLKPEQHGYKNCPAPETCSVCNEKHPTSLHKLRTHQNSNKRNDTSSNSYHNSQPHGSLAQVKSTSCTNSDTESHSDS